MLSTDISSNGIDRRTSNRVPFAGVLGVATYDGDIIPQRESFLPVRGFDLSHSGISFATDSWPRSDSLVVSLGDTKSPILVAAHVIGCDRNHQAAGDTTFEVRCEFVKWLT